MCCISMYLIFGLTIVAYGVYSFGWDVSVAEKGLMCIPVDTLFVIIRYAALVEPIIFGVVCKVNFRWMVVPVP